MQEWQTCKPRNLIRERALRSVCQLLRSSLTTKEHSIHFRDGRVTMFKPNTKLTLRRETVKTLRAEELVAVIGREASTVSKDENCPTAAVNAVLALK